MIAVGTLGAAIFTDLKHQLASYDQDKDVVMMAPSVDADPATDHNEAASMTAPFVENAADAGAVALDDDGEGSIEGYPEPQRSNFIRSCESTTNTRYLQTMGSAAPSGYASSMCACVMNYMEGDLPIEEFVQYDLAMSRGESGTHPETERKMGSYLGFCVRDYANSAAN
jgi:hypothetical protein